MMTEQTNLPLFYRQIDAFDTARHGPLRRPASADFRFAAGATVIPLLISELPLAMRHYPLVFLPGGEGRAPTLAVLVSLGDERNLFVDAAGAWRAGAYIPAYVRRYPFHALRVDTQTDPLLAIDATYVAAPDGEPLVTADGKPSPFLDEMLTFAREYLVAAERTEPMCLALQEAGVLEEGDITLQAEGGEAHRINGFLSVSEERLRALPADALVKLHQADALGLAYAQLLSLANLVHLPLVMAEKSDPVGSSRSRKKAH
jgi:hypothetical protein